MSCEGKISLDKVDNLNKPNHAGDQRTVQNCNEKMREQVPMTILDQTIGIVVHLVTELFGCPLGAILTFYLLFFTRLWWVMCIYLAWIYVLDKDTCEKGGRSVNWVRNSKIWTYVYDYFSSKLVVVDGVTLDAKKNYLFATFPHGFINTTPPINLSAYASGVKNFFPHHTPYICTVKSLISFPIHRELLYAMGLVSCSAKSLSYLLGTPGGGTIATLMVGGAEEAFYCKPGVYKLVVKNRKGFVKIALKNGSPIVPVFSFNETDIWDQVEYAPGSFMRSWQDWCKKVIGFAPVMPLGRGFLQPLIPSFIPRRAKLTLCVGKPIDVEKIENPSQEQIDALHQKFVEELEKLFESEKHKYLENAENTKLELV